ncbi:hypothetical protein EDD21DRAFT_240846 [Dissophora ornata]|nr:hypothetical protein EDD21DRAFT_240846 [Dissophora ornata]
MVIALATSTKSFKSGFIIVEDPCVVREHKHEEFARATHTHQKQAADILSYSGATKMNLTEDDHGIRVGLTENYLNETSTVSDPQDSQHHPPSQEPAAISSKDSSFVSQDVIQDYEQSPPQPRYQSHGLLDNSKRSTVAAATTTLSLEYGHGLFQGVNKNHNEGAKNDKSSLDSSTKECTIDEHGLPVIDVRRDSGFDLLL